MAVIIFSAYLGLPDGLLDVLDPCDLGDPCASSSAISTSLPEAETDQQDRCGVRFYFQSAETLSHPTLRCSYALCFVDDLTTSILEMSSGSLRTAWMSASSDLTVEVELSRSAPDSRVQ